MFVFAVFRRLAYGPAASDTYHFHKAFDSKEKADAFAKSKNGNQLCRYHYATKRLRIE